MNCIKRILFLLLCLCCAFPLVMPAFATEIEPIADATNDFRATLSIDLGGQASCGVTGKASLTSHKIEIVMSLSQLGNPVPLKSWSANGTGKLSMSENYYVSRGHDYQVTATITVKDSNGRFIESITANSKVIHY